MSAKEYDPSYKAIQYQKQLSDVLKKTRSNLDTEQKYLTKDITNSFDMGVNLKDVFKKATPDDKVSPDLATGLGTLNKYFENLAPKVGRTGEIELKKQNLLDNLSQDEVDDIVDLNKRVTLDAYKHTLKKGGTTEQFVKLKNFLLGSKAEKVKEIYRLTQTPVEDLSQPETQTNPVSTDTLQTPSANTQDAGSFGAGKSILGSLDPEDLNAFEWASNNKDDPRSLEIFKKLGL